MKIKDWSFEAHIKATKDELKTWPEWMKSTAHFSGTGIQGQQKEPKSEVSKPQVKAASKRTG